ncbi:MAG: stage V sporulation protein K, partial [Ruminococcus sp.]|nr:stage V sporulation protein K [Ruminococcus sp.]
YGFFEKRCGKNIRNFANARDVRNYFEKAITNQADRIANIPDISDEDLMTIRLEDVSRITLD